MKQFILFLLTSFALAMGAAAQNTAHNDSMFVCQKSGKVVSYAVSKVDSIVYEKPGKPVAIDLGLSVKWANINVGAISPEYYGGYYYMWGETKESIYYSESNYPYYSKENGYEDLGENIAGTEYDVAHTLWGGEWRMPTSSEFRELRTGCDWTWTTQNGTSGYKITGTNGNSIFLPATGYCRAGQRYAEEEDGNYWISNPNDEEKYPQYALCCAFDSEVKKQTIADRYVGLSVRGVCPQDFNPGESEDAPADSMYVCYASEEMMGYAISDVDSIVFEKPNPEPKAPDWARPIDLGLSVKWANMNIGAQRVNEIGSYYSWGEIEEKNCYDKSHYQYYSDGTYQDLGEDIAGTQYDVAHAKWGGEWRMPTVDEMNELLTKCTWMWTTSPSMNDIHGYLVTGPNGETLFFPAVGCYSGTVVTNKDVAAYFWTSACNTDNQYAHALCLYETMHWVSRVSRQTGVVVRAVCP